MLFTLFSSFRNIKLPLRFYSNKGVMNILGIESSCDDTGAAVINTSGTILGQSLNSQSRMHVECGGISGHIAAELHQCWLKEVVEKSMRASQLDFDSLDSIAVTVTPGLILSLTAGVDYAKSLCILFNKPLIPIHHMEAHALMVRLTEDVKFPYLTLLISGGHCILALVKSPTKFYKLGESLSNSPGQVLDHVARRAKLQNLKYSRGLVGGAAIEKLALEGDPTAFNFPNNVLTHVRSCDFSFSGFTAVAKSHIEEQEKNNDFPPDAVLPNINDFCASLQWSLTRHLCQRLEFALLYVNKKNLLPTNEKYLVVSGGVASNKFIKSALKFVCDNYDFKIVTPSPEYCTDNGVMIAWNAIEKLRENSCLVKPNELDSVVPIQKNQLGEDISEDVKEILRTMNIKKLKLNDFLKAV